MLGLDAILNIGGKLIEKLIPDPAAQAKAQLELATLAQSGELTKLANETELYKTEQNNLTARVQADMASDSWLSKNVRPLVLIFLVVCTVLMIFIDAGTIAFQVEDKWTDLLQLVLITVIGAYFGGRSFEKRGKK